jgi:hypothetical protein
METPVAADFLPRGEPTLYRGNCRHSAGSPVFQREAGRSPRRGIGSRRFRLLYGLLSHWLWPYI